MPGGASQSPVNTRLLRDFGHAAAETVVCRTAGNLLEAYLQAAKLRGAQVNIRVLSILAILIGLALEIMRVGSQYSVGTVVAGIGIIVFVYDRMARPPKS